MYAKITEDSTTATMFANANVEKEILKGRVMVVAEEEEEPGCCWFSVCVAASACPRLVAVGVEVFEYVPTAAGTTRGCFVGRTWTPYLGGGRESGVGVGEEVGVLLFVGKRLLLLVLVEFDILFGVSLVVVELMVAGAGFFSVSVITTVDPSVTPTLSEGEEEGEAGG